jgi:hypothetical protein
MLLYTCRLNKGELQMAIQNTFYTIAHTSEVKINNRKKATPDNLTTVWRYDADNLSRYETLEQAQHFAQEYDTYKIYKTTVVEETA